MAMVKSYCRDLLEKSQNNVNVSYTTNQKFGVGIIIIILNLMLWNITISKI